MTDEEVVWRWLKLTQERRSAAARRMMEDGRIDLGKKLELVPVGDHFEHKVFDTQEVA